jgi:multisubunit Na+/H+ antiporter MnhF subunit
MSEWFILVCQVCLAAMFVSGAMCLYRITVGPNAADRAVGMDTLTSVFIGIICILCILWQSSLYFDSVWILTLVGFLGSTAIAKYMMKGRVFS